MNLAPSHHLSVHAVTVAVKDKMDLAIGVAVGSSMQVALLITSGRCSGLDHRQRQHGPLLLRLSNRGLFCGCPSRQLSDTRWQVPLA